MEMLDLNIENCWDYFKCPEEFRNKCEVYLNLKKGNSLLAGWFFFDPSVGGPAKNGPCIKCKIGQKIIAENLKLLDIG